MQTSGIDPSPNQPAHGERRRLSVGTRAELVTEAAVAILLAADERDRAGDRVRLVGAGQRVDHGARVVDVTRTAARGVIEAAVPVLLAREPVGR